MKDRSQLLILNHSAELGGAELCLLDYLRRTDLRADTILFETGPLHDLMDKVGVDTETLDAGSVLDIRSSGGAWNTLAATPALLRISASLVKHMRASDVVYANSQKAMVVAAIANTIARRPLIWHCHDIMTAPHFSKGMKRIAVALSNRFGALMIANSEATARAYEEAGGSLPVKVVYNGIDPAPFRNLDRSVLRSRLATEIGSGDAPLIAMFGRLSPWKGQEVAIEAIASLDNTHLVLVGEGLFGDGEYADSLRRSVVRQGLDSRVHFLGFREDIPELMAGANVVIHCSTAPEPFGRVIVEAMMSGTPVVASGAGGALEIIESGVNGLLVAPGDPLALRDAITSLLDDQATASRIASAGSAHALARFSLDRMVASTDDIVQSVMRQRR
ncbi:MAG: glycosyltransferase family 4 protein [Erythrobacter sp.]|nr:glycosyltransferase family 4 protein [Erythrobacter sp.]